MAFYLISNMDLLKKYQLIVDKHPSRSFNRCNVVRKGVYICTFNQNLKSKYAISNLLNKFIIL